MKRRRYDNIIGTDAAVYYFLSFTVGLPMSLLGAALAALMLLGGHKPFMFYKCFCFEIGKYSGFSLGCFVFVGKRCKRELLVHEFGHSIQNCMYGPFMPFVVGIPSAVRFHYRRFRSRVLKQKLTSPYESVWFEAEATALGESYIRRLKNKAKAESALP